MKEKEIRTLHDCASRLDGFSVDFKRMKGTVFTLYDSMNNGACDAEENHALAADAILTAVEALDEVLMDILRETRAAAKRQKEGAAA